MNLLPDMIILDFCQWLQNTAIFEQRDIDLWDLIVDEQYTQALKQYAIVFLQQYKPSFKSILHSYIDSEEFDDSIETCRFYREEIELDRRNGGKIHYSFIHHCFHEGRFDHSFCRFIRRYYGDIDNFRITGSFQRIKPYELTQSVRYIFSNIQHEPWLQRDKKMVLNFINRLNVDLDIEIDFLEWLIDTYSKPLDIHKMPLQTFEKYAEDFKLNCNKTESDIKKLIKSFKQTDLIILSEKLLSALPFSTAKKAKDLGYIIHRYQDINVKYKCFIVPLQAESDEYKELVTKRWSDLHHLSGNYLDIYYTSTDYGKSGFEIMNRMNYIPDNLKTRAPIIVLWENDLAKAKGIDISRLDNADVYEVIQHIVNLIQKKMCFDDIIVEANQMSRKLRDAHRAIHYETTNNTINNTGAIYGNVANVNNGVMDTSNIDTGSSNRTLLDEIEAAKLIIESYSEINDQQKMRLSEILDDTKSALSSGEDAHQSKKSFKDAICFMGNVGSKLITALSHLTNILKFLGVNIPPTP